MTILSPFVFWAQNKKVVFIKVDLKDTQNPDIKLEQNKLDFRSRGVGAQGLNDYQFTLSFNKEIDVNKSNYKITDNRVDFRISKVQNCWWPRLMSQSQKPVWLKIDHDRFESEDMEDKEEVMSDVRKDYPTLYDKLQKEEFGYKKEDFKMVYLSLYNLFMFVGYMYIVVILSVRYLRDGYASLPGTYEATAPAMCFMQLLQCLEILHPMFGYVKGGVKMPLMQISGRLFVLFAMLHCEVRLQKMPVVFYLFLAWSSIEVIRYPYYMSQLMKKDNALLTWLRYSAWMVCYPIGFTCEIVIIFRNLIFIDQSKKWALDVPFINYTLQFSTVLRVYMLFLMIPAIYTLMKHMYNARKQKYSHRKPWRKVQ